MAKKAKTSARSKGYRKTEQKKPFLTKKDILWLCAIVAAIALAIVLFNVFYDNGALPMADGAPVVNNAEESLILKSVSDDETEYFKLAEVGEVAGYRREQTPDTSDPNVLRYYFYPEDEASRLTSIRISGGARGFEDTAQAYASSVSYSGGVVTGSTREEIDGRDVITIVSLVGTTNTETGVTTYTQDLHAYFASSFKDRCVIVTETVTFEAELTEGEDPTALLEEKLMTQDELIEILREIVPAISTDSKK